MFWLGYFLSLVCALIPIHVILIFRMGWLWSSIFTLYLFENWFPLLVWSVRWYSFLPFLYLLKSCLLVSCFPLVWLKELVQFKVCLEILVQIKVCFKELVQFKVWLKFLVQMKVCFKMLVQFKFLLKLLVQFKVWFKAWCFSVRLASPIDMLNKASTAKIAILWNLFGNILKKIYLLDSGQDF